MRDTQRVVGLSDISVGAREVYFKRLSEMAPSERVSMGVALWEAGDSLQRAAIRRNSADMHEAEISFRVAVTRFGLELARKVYHPVLRAEIRESDAQTAESELIQRDHQTRRVLAAEPH